MKNNCCTHPCGEKDPNPLGLYDMSGNVYERCWVWYCDTYNNSLEKYLSGPEFSSNRVLRGGAWNYEVDNCRVAYRFKVTPDHRNVYIGFRPARTEKL